MNKSNVIQNVGALSFCNGACYHIVGHIVLAQPGFEPGFLAYETSVLVH